MAESGRNNEILKKISGQLEAFSSPKDAVDSKLLLANEQLRAQLQEMANERERLVLSELRFRRMIEGVKDYAIFMLDAEGRVASWNEGAYRLKGYESSEIIGHHLSKFYPDQDITLGRPERELEIARETGRYEEEGWRKRKDGSQFWASVILTRIDAEDGGLVGYTKVTRDLSERKRAEERLQEAHDQLERRVKSRTAELRAALSARDEFLSIASHELKTPLTSLKLQAQMNLRKLEGANPEFTKEELHRSYSLELKQISFLSVLIDDLLDISRIQAGRLDLSPQEINFSELVGEVLSRFSELFRANGCQVETSFAEGIIGHWDKRRLEQVVSNLFSNITKYAPGSRVHVSTKWGEGRTYLEISDSGPGIPKNKQELIFERFERANEQRSIGGLGLGLYIVRKIVQAHKGLVTVESELGKGTRFTIELPTTLAVDFLGES